MIVDEIYRSIICQLLNKGLIVDKINRSINLLINSSGTKKELRGYKDSPAIPQQNWLVPNV